MNKILLITT